MISFRKVTKKVLRTSLPVTIKKWSKIPLIMIIGTYSKKLHIVLYLKKSISDCDQNNKKLLKVNYKLNSKGSFL